MGDSEATVSPPPDRRGDRVRGAVRVLGEVLITLGLVLLLFVFYEVEVTGWFSAREQREAGEHLRQRWAQQPAGPPAAPPREGAGFAELSIPALGHDVHYTVLEGTDAETLAHRRRVLGDPLRTLIERGKLAGEFSPALSTEWCVRSFGALLLAGARGVADGTLTRDEAPALVFRSLHEGLHA